MRPAHGLATMESDNGILCRTGRVLGASSAWWTRQGWSCERAWSTPILGAISVYVTSRAPNAVRIGLETGLHPHGYEPSSKRLGLPVICIDARHAKAVLKMQINKSDRNDAIGIARIMQTGWFKEVHVEDIDSHSVRALLASRARCWSRSSVISGATMFAGLLKNLGLVIGRAKFNVFAVRAEELIEGRPELMAAIRPLLEARNAVEQQVSELDRKVMKLARHDTQVRRFMTAPGVGPITALCFKATIDDPTRFARSRSVGAYVGLTSRRHASGEVGGPVRSRSVATRCYEVICLKQPGFC